MLTVGDVQKVVCDYYDIDMADMLGERKRKYLANARAQAYKLCRDHVEHMTVNYIADAFFRCPTTVSYMSNKLDTTTPSYIELEQLIKELK